MNYQLINSMSIPMSIVIVSIITFYVANYIFGYGTIPLFPYMLDIMIVLTATYYTINEILEQNIISHISMIPEFIWKFSVFLAASSVFIGFSFIVCTILLGIGLYLYLYCVFVYGSFTN